MVYVVLALIALVIGYVYLRQTPEFKRAKAAAVAESTKPEFAWPPLGDYDFEVVGESFYQDILQTLAGPHGDDSPERECTAVLVPYAHPKDDKAVKVLIDGYTVGHLSRDDARSFRRRLGTKKLTGKPTSCSAMIVGGFRMKDGSKASYGVNLDLKPFE